MADSKTNYFDINRIWSAQQNRWLYNNYIINFVGFLFYAGLLADILVLVVRLKAGEGTFLVSQVTDSNRFLFIFNFGFSYYWDLSFVIALWGCVTLLAFLSTINNAKIWVVDKNNVRYQFLSHYLFWRNLTVTIVGAFSILYICLSYQSAAFNVPFNETPTLISADDYYFPYAESFELGANVFGVNPIIDLYIKFLVVVVIFAFELLVSSTLFLAKRIGFIKVNQKKYLNLDVYIPREIKMVKRIRKLESKIEKLKNR